MPAQDDELAGVAGIMVAFVAAGVQVGEISLYEHFNHNDLYHLIQAVSFWLLYRAGLLLSDRVSPCEPDG